MMFGLTQLFASRHPANLKNHDDASEYARKDAIITLGAMLILLAGEISYKTYISHSEVTYEQLNIVLVPSMVSLAADGLAYLRNNHIAGQQQEAGGPLLGDDEAPATVSEKEVARTKERTTPPSSQL